MSKFFFLIARATLTTPDHTSMVWSACQEPEDKVAGDTAQRRPESGVWVWSTVHLFHVHTELGACFHNATTRPGSMATPVWNQKSLANSCFSLAGILEPICLSTFGAQGRTGYSYGRLLTAIHTTAEPATFTRPCAVLGRRWNVVRNYSKCELSRLQPRTLV